LQIFSQKFNKKLTGISPDAENVLLAHNWTGHVRELKNLVERAVLIGKGPDLLPGDLGINIHAQNESKALAGDKTGFAPLQSDGLDLDAQLQSFEKHYIEEALKIANGNESKAAKLLNINHHTFRYRRKKLFGK
jgi:transcriptional regulator with PAS, ATPase and Fis domain